MLILIKAALLIPRTEVTLISGIGPVIGSHCGAGTFAIFFIGKHR